MTKKCPVCNKDLTNEQSNKIMILFGLEENKQKIFLEYLFDSICPYQEGHSNMFMKKKGKYLIYDLEKNGHPFKLLVESDKETGQIKQIIEKPNFKKMEYEIFLSGSHIVIDFPERNHIDYYKDRKKVSVEKTPNNYFNYWVSGDVWGI